MHPIGSIHCPGLRVISTFLPVARIMQLTIPWMVLYRHQHRKVEDCKRDHTNWLPMPKHAKRNSATSIGLVAAVVRVNRQLRVGLRLSVACTTTPPTT